MPYMVSKSDGDDNWSSFGDKAYEYFYQILSVLLTDNVDIFLTLIVVGLYFTLLNLYSQKY